MTKRYPRGTVAHSIERVAPPERTQPPCAKCAPSQSSRSFTIPVLCPLHRPSEPYRPGPARPRSRVPGEITGMTYNGDRSRRPDNQGPRTTGVQLEEHASDLLSSERPTRTPPDSRESPAGGLQVHPRTVSAPGVCWLLETSLSQRKHRKLARRPRPRRPNSRLARAAGPGQPGGGVAPEARAPCPGPVPGSDAHRGPRGLMRSGGLAASARLFGSSSSDFRVSSQLFRVRLARAPLTTRMRTVTIGCGP